MNAPAATRSGCCRNCARPLTGSSELCLACVSTRLTVGGATADPTPNVPRLPAGYEYIAPLGSGGMGEVYLVFQPSLGRYVALKQMSGRWQADHRARERFLREAQAAAQLSHPGIVPILEIGADATPVWYTMEYCEGGDLANLLARKGGRMPWPEAVDMIRLIAVALQFAHAAGVAHRDLKPSNILLGEGGQPRLADFGLAWLAGQEGRDLTATGEVLGTPAYLPPESVSGGSRTMDPRRGDIYSLGAVLFHLVAGRTPFEGAHPMEILGAIVREPVPLLGTLAAEPIPAALERATARCLEKTPTRRFADMRALIAGLDACLERRTRWAPRRRIGRTARWIAVAGLAVAAAVVGGYGWRRNRSATENGRRRAEPIVAVAPLQVIGSDSTATLLADGLQDELVSTLTRMTDLRVIVAGAARASNASVTDFRAVRNALGADAVLGGKVRRVDDKIWIAIQWVDTSDGTTRWSHTYIREDSNAFDLQTDIATEVAAQLHRQLRPSGMDAQRGVLSRNAQAQALFIQARKLITDASHPDQNLKAAAADLTHAIAIDPSFARAQAQLSLVDTQMYLWGIERTQPVLDAGRDAAQAALRLNPELVDAQLAMGLYFMRRSRDYVAARPHVDRAMRLSPNDPAVLDARAQVDRRGGDFVAAADEFERARELDPLNANLAYNTVDTFLRLRRFGRAAAILDHALASMPGQISLRKLRGDLYVAWKGDLLPMAEDIRNRKPGEPRPDLYLMDEIDYLVLAHRIDEALAVVQASGVAVVDGQSVYLVRDGYLAWLYALSGDETNAQPLARRALAQVNGQLAQHKDDPRLLMHAAQLHALIGEWPEAQRQVRRILSRSDPARADAFDRGLYLREYAIMLAMGGKDAEAIAAIRAVLAEPDQTSTHYVALHPALARFAKFFP